MQYILCLLHYIMYRRCSGAVPFNVSRACNGLRFGTINEMTKTSFLLILLAYLKAGHLIFASVSSTLDSSL